jgi:hypothetical protein
MKLYTEEQINWAMRLATLTDDTYNQVLEQLTPIELPSNEEMTKVVEQEYEIHDNNEFLYGRSDELKLAYKAGVWDGVNWINKQIIN